MERNDGRNLFAMSAMQGLLASPAVIKGGKKAIVVYAWELADAMIEEGSKSVPTYMEIGWHEALMAELAEKDKKDAEELP